MAEGIDPGVGMLADLPIFGDYSKRQEEAFDSGDTVNLFLSFSKSGKKKFVFYNTPGIKKKFLVIEGNQAARPGSFFSFNGFFYGVFGASVYRAGSSLVPVFLGSLGTSRGYVSVAVNNNNEIIFVDGQGGYLYKNSTNTFAKITAAGFPPKPLNVICLDGYFIIPYGESRTFGISGLNNGSAWDATDVAQIAAYPGLNVGVGVLNQRAYFFKTDSVAIWYDAGNADFPIRPDNNLLFNFGCLATPSIISGFGMLFWLAKDADGVGSVMMTTGQEAKRISTDSEDDLIASFTNPEDVSVYIYKMSGHIFLSMNWTTDDVSLLYDSTMDMWYRQNVQKKSRIPNVQYSGNTRNLVNSHVYFNGEHLVGSYKDATLYSMSRNFSMNDEEPIVRERACDHFFHPNYLLRQVNSVQLDIKAGVGQSGAGTEVYEDQNDDPLTNPQVYLSTARDNRPFGNDCPAPMGKIGTTWTRAIWRKKGQARDFVFKFKIYAPIAPIAILGGSINYDDLAR